MIGKSGNDLTADNIHQMYGLCMKIEDVRIMEDRNFNLITALKEDAEGDDFDEDARVAE
jgi:hypothetical protein